MCSYAALWDKRKQKRGYDTLKNLLRREVCVEDATGISPAMSGDYEWMWENLVEGGLTYFKILSCDLFA